MQKHQPQQAQHFGILRQRYIGLCLADEQFQHTTETDGVGTQLIADEHLAGGGRVALGEDQVELALAAYRIALDLTQNAVERDFILEQIAMLGER